METVLTILAAYGAYFFGGTFVAALFLVIGVEGQEHRARRSSDEALVAAPEPSDAVELELQRMILDAKAAR